MAPSKNHDFRDMLKSASGTELKGLLVIAALVILFGFPTLTSRFHNQGTVSKYLHPISIGQRDLTRQIMFPENEMKFFRPLWDLSFLAESHLWGLDPLGYHVTQLLGHLLSTCLVYMLFRRFWSESRSAIMAALYGIHPVSFATYSMTDQRGDVFCTFFFCLSFLLATSGVDGHRKSSFDAWGRKGTIPRLLSNISFAAALLFKETAISLPVAVFAYFLVFSPIKLRDRIVVALRKTLSYLVISAVYLVARFYVLSGIGGYHGGASHFRFEPDMFTNMGDIICGFLLLGSYGPHARYLLVAVVVASVCTACALVLMRDRVAIFGMYWIIFTSFLVVSIKRAVFLHMDYARFAYLPMIGFLLIAGRIAWDHFPLAGEKNRRGEVSTGAIVVALLLSVLMGMESRRTWSRLCNSRHSVESDIVHQLAGLVPDPDPGTRIYVVNGKDDYTEGIFWSNPEMETSKHQPLKLQAVHSFAQLLVDSLFPGENVKITEVPEMPDQSILSGSKSIVLDYSNGRLSQVHP